MQELELVDTPMQHQNTQDFSILIDKIVLLKALSHVQSIVEKRNIIPILSNVKIDADNDGLTLTATDMDITVSEKISVKVKAAGSLTVPAHTLYDIIKKLPDSEQVIIQTDKNIAGKLNIDCASCKFSLFFLPAHEFPLMDQGQMSSQFEVSSQELIYLIDNSKFAISSEETRYNLNGIYFHSKKIDDGSHLIASATDGHRLSKVFINHNDDLSDIPSIIVPRKTIMEIRKLLDGATQQVKISLSASKINFSFADISLTSKLIDANFPEYENLIPYDNDKNMEVDVKVFSKAIDRVSIISFDKVRAVKLQISNNKLIISASGESQGSGTEEIDVSYTGEPLVIGFNSKYLLDIMSVIIENTAIFKFKDNYSPTLVTAKNNESSLYVIMPMVV